MSLNLVLNHYELLDMLDEQGMYALEEQFIHTQQLAQVDSQIQQHMENYPEALQQDIETINSKFERLVCIISSVNEDLQSGIIDTVVDTVDSTHQLFEPQSFKSQFHQYTSHENMDDDYIDFQPYGKYHIPLDDGLSDIYLNALLEPKGIDKVLDKVSTARRIKLLLCVMDYQRDYQQNHDKTYALYIEVKTFQENTGLIISDIIQSGQRPNDNDMEHIYDKYQRILPLRKQILDIINS